jgi:ppGpp synthetase/RelA/SpoT-type nucleotidyltranferase
MQYVQPEYSREEVNDAAKALLQADQLSGPITEKWVKEQIHIYRVVNNWRASHQRPLNTFSMTLRNRAKQISGEDIIIAQRVKRLESIKSKLRVQPMMKLSQMQDIAGCRAVLPSVGAVRELERLYRSSTDFSHVLKSSGKDYIVEPKTSGYRGIHLIYRYNLRHPSPHDGQQIEIQLRTKLQHTWATAVEAAGTFTNQALKSSQGSADWQRFFALMGSYIAHLESCAKVPETARLNVAAILQSYSATLKYSEQESLRRVKYYLLDLDAAEQKVMLTQYTAAQSRTANDEYTELERQITSESARQAVLVSVDSLRALRQAYPNYFLDTSEFVSLVRRAVAQELTED